MHVDTSTGAGVAKIGIMQYFRQKEKEKEYESVSKSFRTEPITKSTTINTR
jgi:hypothetical protein